MAAIHRTKEWQRTRAVAWQRSTQCCVGCGCDGRFIRLEAHHVIPINRGGAVHDLANIEFRCGPCHRDIHRKMNPESGGAKRREWINLLETQLFNEVI